MNRTKRTRLLTLAFVLLALLVSAGAAAAHPLGNFTISRYSAVALGAETAEVHYIIDMAEIPTYQERQTIDSDGDGAISAAEEATYLAAAVPALAANLRLEIDGAAVPLSPQRHALTFPPGQGDLLTLRLEMWLSAALPESDGPLAVNYEDGNYPDRLGWREVVMTAAAGTLLESSVPATDLSDQLRAYPADLLQAPPAISRAEARFAPTGAQGSGGAGVQGGQEAATRNSPLASRFGQDEFADLLSRTLDTPAALAAALLVAVGLGAAHALTPGHGKTIVGAYLVGSRGTARHALFLGLTTTITHTAGVFALGFLVLFASEFVLPEKLYPWLGVLSGLLVVGIGLSILRGHVGHWLAHRRGENHDHGPYHFHFGKGHSHGHDHGPRTTDHGAVDLTGVPTPVRSGSGLAFAGAHNTVDLTGVPTPVRSGSGLAFAGAHNTVDLTGVPTPVRSGSSLAFAGVANRAAVASPVRQHTHDHADGHGHDHGPRTTDHGHDHHHDHGHDHGHAAPPDALSWRSLLALGISGGLLPCPSALILMLSAIALRQVGVGLVLILAFSVGLAAVLTGIGLIMVYAGRFLERLPIRHGSLTTRLLPMASATFITIAGLAITYRALVEAGVI